MNTNLPAFDLHALLPAIFAFVAVIACAAGVIMVLRDRANRQIRERLHDVVADRNEEGLDSVILRDIELSRIGFVNSALKGQSWARRLDLLLVQADIKMRVGAFLTLMLVIAGAVALLLDAALGRPYVSVCIGVLA